MLDCARWPREITLGGGMAGTFGLSRCNCVTGAHSPPKVNACTHGAEIQIYTCPCSRFHTYHLWGLLNLQMRLIHSNTYQVIRTLIVVSIHIVGWQSNDFPIMASKMQQQRRVDRCTWWILPSRTARTFNQGIRSPAFSLPSKSDIINFVVYNLRHRI